MREEIKRLFHEISIPPVTAISGCNMRGEY